MKKIQHVWPFSLIIMVAVFLNYTLGAVADSDAKPIAFEMTVTQIVGERGPEPQFNFRIANVSDAPVRVLNFAKRPDLLDIDISRSGLGEELETVISDPNVPD